MFTNFRYIRWDRVFSYIILPFLCCLILYFLWMFFTSITKIRENYINRTETFHITANVVKIKYDEVYTARHNKRRHTYYPVLVEDSNGVQYQYTFDTRTNDNWSPSIGTQVYKDCWTEVDGKKLCSEYWNEDFEYVKTKNQLDTNRPSSVSSKSIN
ncbi:hypothetical protein pEaSNUABM50_00529 [Erwinia phage pEa_SNUABM_50]|uniref:Uncharacterized protein n=1 Tax=Erwinia phage pEa_SNUABM_50 TaxID=2768775 RepID=A0A7L8ZQW3_9CAUD|nr:hypothetical protein pEaSNUABM50_00529 [Erwinia phage pEa_SNUABM_50]QXO12200.1 hypothetical protein pEaSNUABM44_00539 [Erwinia phage pEa_SNUABM_44]